MKKLVLFVAELPGWIFVFSPSICGVFSRSGSASESVPGVLLMLELLVVFWGWVAISILKPNRTGTYLSCVSSILFSFLVFLVMLFLAVVACYLDHKVVTHSYCLPQIILDLFAPRDLAVKLLSIAVLFLLLLPLYQKSKEYYPES